MDSGSTAVGLGDAARAFLEGRLVDLEARMKAAPPGSVARTEASEEAREIKSILEADRLALEAAVASIARARVGEATRASGPKGADGSSARVCPTCRAPRLGAFRYCRTCGYDFEGEVGEHELPVKPTIIR